MLQKKLQRITLVRSNLFKTVFAICVIAIVYLSLWTGLDPIQRTDEFFIQGSKTLQGKTIVNVAYYCNTKSKSPVWYNITLVWRAVLLFVATILSVQMRGVRKDFDESTALTVLIYSHCGFLLVIFVITYLKESLDSELLDYSRSIVYTLDALAAVAIYFVPKFLPSKDKWDENNFGQES